jgi:hypothetical protein
MPPSIWQIKGAHMTFKKIAAATTLLVTCLAAQPSLAASCQDDASTMRNEFMDYLAMGESFYDMSGNPISRDEAMQLVNNALAGIVSNGDSCTMNYSGETLTWQAGNLPE